MEIYREPVGETYSIKLTLRAGDVVSSLAQPDVSILVDDLLL